MIFLLILFSFSDGKASHEWQWPVTTAYGATSSFGEFRGDRFHMGLDFSTAGVEGEPVRPARGGLVEKVRAQNNGYGRVIYLRHPDRKITVYAHLAAFGSALAKAISAKGYDPESYFGTLALDLNVGIEEIIAYTGESGAGLPHFHFEIRDGENRPMDPLTLDFPPLPENKGKAVLENVTLLPLAKGATVNGTAFPFAASNRIRAIRAEGRIGVQIAAYVNGPRGSRLGCRGVRLFAGETQVGEWLPRNIDFEDYHKAGLIYDQCLSGFSPTRFVYCFDGRSEFLPKVAGFRHQAGIEVAQGVKLSIQLMDLAGNWSRHEVELSPDAPPLPDNPMPESPIQATSLETEVFQNLYRFQASSLGGTLTIPQKMMGLAEGEAQLFEAPSGMYPFEVLWHTKAGSLTRLVGCLPPGSDFSYRIENWTLVAEGIPSLSAVAVMLGPPDPKAMSGTLAYESPVLVFGRNGLPTPGLSATYAAEQNSGTLLGLYAWSIPGKRWQFWGNIEATGKLGVEIGYTTPIVIARDLSPPTILKPKFHHYFSGKKVVVPLRDQGSGIDPETIEVNDKAGKIPIEYDSDRHWIILPTSATGPWSVSVKDRAGHQAQTNGLKL